MRMFVVRRHHIAFAVMALFVNGHVGHALTPAGIVFEAEDIADPGGWVLDQRSPDKWTLWTKEADIEKKRSRGAVMASPAVESDRTNPESGAPPLHCTVTNLMPGTYSVLLSAPGRPLACSLNGREWIRYKGGEWSLGIHDLKDGRFEFWIDDRYAHPKANPGAGYFDYVRFVPVEPEALLIARESTWVGMDASISRGSGGWVVPARDCRLEGFEAEGREIVKAEGPPAKLTYVFEKSGKFHLAVQMIDDRDGVERLDVLLNGLRIGLIYGDSDTDARALFRLKRPIEVKSGDSLTLAPLNRVGLYRIERLLFSLGPILPPPLVIRDVEVWSPSPGVAHVCWTTSRSVESQRLLLSSDAGRIKDIEIAEGPARNHRAILTGLDQATAYRAEIRAELDGKQTSSNGFTVRAAAPVGGSTVAQSIPLLVREPTAVPRAGGPAVVGLPFGRSKLTTPEGLRLFGADGKPVPLQADLAARWNDGSVKFATISFLAETSAEKALAYRLESRPDWARAGEMAPTAVIKETKDAWHIGGSGLHFDLNKKVPALFENVAFDRNGDEIITGEERVCAPPQLANLRLETGDGVNLTCGPVERFDVECNGGVRAVLRWSGPLVCTKNQKGWAYVIRATLYARVPEVRLGVTIINDNPEPKYREVKMIALRLPLEAQGGVVGALDGAGLVSPGTEGLMVQQDDENRSRMTGLPRGGKRMPGIAVVADNKSRITVATRDFWQSYPSGYAIKSDGLHIRILPPLEADACSGVSELDALRLFGWFRNGRYIFKAGQAIQKEFVIRYGAADDSTDPVSFGQWAQAPLIPQAPPEYLCGSGMLSRPIFPSGTGAWQSYDDFFEKGFRASLEDREKQRTFGWMHFGDWFGERLLNYGNNEYDMPWAMAVQWARSGDSRYFERGLEMARHHSTIDTVHGSFSDRWNGLVYEHSFNHVGIDIAPDDPRLKQGLLARYMAEFGAMLGGAIDRQGHVFQAGNWVYATLTGDGWLREVAKRVSDNQAERLTPAFDFTIERAGGWPIINMTMAHHFSGDPYYLNAARIMVERAIDRQDPASGGWLQWHAGSESGGEQGMGGKAFAVGILSHGLLRYLEQEPNPRPDVERMLIRGADFLRDHAWVPGKGFRYISHLKYHAEKPRRGGSEGLNAEMVAFAYEKTRDERYREFLNDMIAGQFDKPPSGNGKSFTMQVRQTVYGLDRMRGFGMTAAPGGTASK